MASTYPPPTRSLNERDRAKITRHYCRRKPQRTKTCPDLALLEEIFDTLQVHEDVELDDPQLLLAIKRRQCRKRVPPSEEQQLRRVQKRYDELIRGSEFSQAPAPSLDEHWSTSDEIDTREHRAMLDRLDLIYARAHDCPEPSL